MHKIHDWLKASALLMALEATVVMLASYYACYYLSHAYDFHLPEIGGLWGAISAIFVLSDKRLDFKNKTRSRLYGSIIGSAVTCACVYLVGHYNFLSYLLAIFFSVLVLGLLNIREMFRVACITAAVIFVVGYTHPHLHPWINALSRLIESIVGMAVAWLVDFAVYPIRKYFDLF